MRSAAKNNFTVQIRNLSKSYSNISVLNDLNLTLNSGNIYCLMAPSGTGKTTLFRILMGLDKPDFGEITGLNHARIAAVFQEDRLLEGYTALENIRFVTGKTYSNRELNEILNLILPPNSSGKPVHEFSGGMKRRTSVLRAILAPSNILIMDEPFTGLDMETKRNMIRLILEYADDKLILIATHSPEDAALLSADVISLER